MLPVSSITKYLLIAYSSVYECKPPQHPPLQHFPVHSPLNSRLQILRAKKQHQHSKQLSELLSRYCLRKSEQRN